MVHKGASYMWQGEDVSKNFIKVNDTTKIKITPPPPPNPPYNPAHCIAMEINHLVTKPEPTPHANFGYVTSAS